MKKLTKNLIFAIFSAAMLSGCVERIPYHIKELNPEAKGIAMVRSTPYGCQVLGEAEGKESLSNYTVGFSNANRDKLRDSALNDLRNQAREIVATSKKRITLRVIDEQVGCNGKCPNVENLDPYITSYKITAQIFECGAKDTSESSPSSESSKAPAKKKAKK